MNITAANRWRSPWKAGAAGGAIFAGTIAAYWPSLRGDFLWNDSDYVTAPALRAGSGLGRIWAKIGATQQYYPVLHSSFWLQHRLWGDAAVGYHAVSILEHATAACLLAAVLRRILAGPTALFASCLAGAMFALHPVAVESVAWITEQKNTLSMVFYLAAALVYLRWVGTGVPARPCRLEGCTERTDGRDARPYLYLLATALFILAILSKTTAVTLPAALLVVFWWQRGKLGWRRDVWPLVPWFGLGIAAALLSSWVERRYVGAAGIDFSLGAPQRLLVAGRAVWFYLGKLIWPADLVFIYPKWSPDPAVWWQWLFPAGLAAVAAALWLFRRRSRAPLAAFLFFVGSLFPVLGFFNFYGSLYSFVADHWQYLPAAGVMALGAAGLAAALGRLSPAARRTGQACALGLPLCWGALTWRQCRVYHDVETLYRATIAKNPGCWMAYNNLGNELMRTGRLPEAIQDFELALRARDSSTTRNSLGVALSRMGRTDQAMEAFAEALRLEPGYPEARSNFADALAQKGRLAEAVAEYEQTLRIKPDFALAQNNLGNVLFALGRPQEALARYREALRLDPAYAEAQVNLGNVLFATGSIREAIAHYEEAIRLKPELPETQANLVVALRRLQSP